MKTDWSNYTIAYDGINYSVNYRDNGDLVACENYVANSPTPKNHQPLVSNLPAGPYKIKDWKGDWWEFTLAEDLGGIGAVRDSVEWDKYSHYGWSRRNTNKLTLNGSEVWEKNADFGDYKSFYLNKSTYGAFVKESMLQLCTHFPTTVWVYGLFDGNYWWTAVMSMGIRIHKDYLPTYDSLTTDAERIALFKAWLSTQHSNGTPVTVWYRLDTPTRTPLTFTKNNSSTAPKCPMEFLTNTPSLEYPAEVFDASGTLKVANADESQSVSTTIPPLRSNQDGTVYDEFEVKTGKVTRKIGRIESYNGEDVGDDWISSTGALDTGATVEYVLAEPIEEQHTPVTLPTHYPTTVVTTTNDNIAEMETTITCKVEDS